jgi:hypothetical protein
MSHHNETPLQFKYNNYLKQNTRGFSLIQKEGMTNVQFEMIKEYPKKEIESSKRRGVYNHTSANTRYTG